MQRNEIFVGDNDQWESLLVKLMVQYTNSVKRSTVVELSKSAQSLIKSQVLNIQVPSMVASESDYLTSCAAICLQLATVSGCKSILFGNDYKQESKTISYLEIAQQNPFDYTQVLNEELETKTYFVGSHLSFADLAIFISSYKYMTSIKDEKKWEICNFFRWFNHIQNLPGISLFLQAQGLPKSSFPQKVKVNNKGKKNDDKKQKPQKGAEKKGEEKQQQQKPQQKKGTTKEEQEKKAAEKKANKEKQQQQAKQQKAKKGAQQPEEPLKAPEDPLFFEQNLDIRVGEIKKVWKHPESDKLWCEEIDVGEGTNRQIASGLQGIIPEEGMSGLVCVMTNLKARKLRGFPSNGMVMCASSEDRKVIQILRPPQGAKIGERIKLEGLEDKFRTEPLALQKDKLNILPQAFPLLKSDANKCATYAGVRFIVNGQPCTTEGVANGNVA